GADPAAGAEPGAGAAPGAGAGPGSGAEAEPAIGSAVGLGGRRSTRYPPIASAPTATSATGITQAARFAAGGGGVIRSASSVAACARLRFLFLLAVVLAEVPGVFAAPACLPLTGSATTGMPAAIAASSSAATAAPA